MALPSSGAISLNAVNVELNLPGTTTISLNQSSVRTLFGIASGAIRMSDGYGKSSAVVAAVTSLTGSPSYRCWNQSFDQDISWYIGSGTGSITVYLQRTAYNNCSGWSEYPTAITTVTAGTWVSINAESYRSVNNNMAFRLRMVNSAGTSYSAGIGVVYDWCDQYDYCSTSDNCSDNGSYGCHNCSQTCNCPACTYDCNCDCVTGYGTGGCSCGSDCSWCENSQNYECTCDCYGCCDENNENCTCDCYGCCSWVSNPNYPCPCSQQTCSTDCYCPCGETCSSGDRRTCQTHNGVVWTSSWSAC